MKHFFLFLSLVFFIQLDAQRQPNGFIAFSLGPSIPMEEFADKNQNSSTSGLAKTGLNMNLVNFGYNFGKEFGICGHWFGSSYFLDLGNGSEVMWSMGGLSAGPMITLQLGEKSFLDFKGLIGYTSVSLNVLDNVERKGTGFCFDIGSQIRLNFAPKWGFLVGLDYFNTSAKVSNFREQQITSINANIGIIFNFKRVYEN